MRLTDDQRKALKWKLEAIDYCLFNDFMSVGHEDVLRHLGDLFHFLVDGLNEDLEEQGDTKIFSKTGAYKYYFDTPESPEEWPVS